MSSWKSTPALDHTTVIVLAGTEAKVESQNVTCVRSDVTGHGDEVPRMAHGAII